MSERADYQRLLEATVNHLERLRQHGVKYVKVDADRLQALAKPMPANPAPVASMSDTMPHAASPPANTLDGGKSSGPDQPEAGPGAHRATVMPQGAKDREQAMAELRERALVCVKCPHLARSRRNVVFGVGNIYSPLMFVGEAPGADEDAQGEPFVGRAGELLTRIIQTMGLRREEVYIANILKCRPDTPGQRSGNRKPRPEEMQTCIPYLHAQIDIIEPKVLVALGATAVEGLLGRTEGITRLRGNWRTYRDIAMMPTYHPAFLLRNQSNTEKRKVWEDMLQVMERLGMPISEVQRGYFLGKS